MIAKLIATALLVGGGVLALILFGSDPVPENASSENERNLAKSKLTGAGGFA